MANFNSINQNVISDSIDSASSLAFHRRLSFGKNKKSASKTSQASLSGPDPPSAIPDSPVNPKNRK